MRCNQISEDKIEDKSCTSSEDDFLSPAMLMAWEFRVPKGMVMVMMNNEKERVVEREGGRQRGERK